MTYFDTSYLLKCYLNEPGSGEVRELASCEGRVACCRFGAMELRAALHRKLREGEIGREAYDAVREQITLDEEQRLWRWLPITGTLVALVLQAFETAPSTSFLRTGDAIHLACARENGFTRIYSNDRHLLDAAGLFGLEGTNVLV